MKLIEREFGIEIDLKENHVSVLVIENISRRLSMIHQLYGQIIGQEGTWILTDGCKSYDMKKKCDLILEPFSLELNNKRIVTKLYGEIKEIANEECYEVGIELHTHVCSYLETLLQKVPYPMKYNDSWDVSNVLKMYEVGVLEDDEDLFERILNYIKMMNQIAGVEIFIAVNLKQLLTEKQIRELYKTAFYCKIQLVLIEFNTGDIRLSEECIYILDGDDCIITY